MVSKHLTLLNLGGGYLVILNHIASQNFYIGAQASPSQLFLIILLRGSFTSPWIVLATRK